MKRTILAVITIMTFFSCKKDNSDAPGMEILLTQKEWIVSSLKHSTGSSDGWPGIGNMVCDGDNRYSFTYSGSGGGTFQVKSGIEKCSQSEAEVKNYGPWTISAIEKQLNIYGPYDGVFYVLSLTETEMELRTEVGDDVLTYTFVHP